MMHLIDAKDLWEREHDMSMVQMAAWSEMILSLDELAYVLVRRTKDMHVMNIRDKLLLLFPYFAGTFVSTSIPFLCSLYLLR